MALCTTYALSRCAQSQDKTTLCPAHLLPNVHERRPCQYERSQKCHERTKPPRPRLAARPGARSSVSVALA